MKAEHIADGVITLFLLPILIPLWIFVGIKWIVKGLAILFFAFTEALAELRERVRP